MSLRNLWTISAAALFFSSCYFWNDPPLPADDTGSGSDSAANTGTVDTNTGDSDTENTHEGTDATDSDSETEPACEEVCDSRCCGDQCCEKPDDVCYEGVCCTPTTCETQKTVCGQIQDGCGGTLECGTCPAATPYCSDEGQCLECITPEDESCGAFACDTQNAVCYDTCGSAAECAAEHYCQYAGCQPQKADGQACESENECVSGVCNDTCGCGPDCDGKECGPDGCGGTCSPGCSEPYGCDEATGTCVQCIDQSDFTFCTLVTAPDYGYDVCIDGTCVSPGTCGDSAECNSDGVHFEIPPDNVPTSQYQRKTDGEPVVTDRVTGLVWQGCSAGQSGADCAVGEANTYNWQKAIAYCDYLSWGGYDDWYLPNEHELLSIIDYGSFNPAVDATAFPTKSFPSFNSGIYWSASVASLNPYWAWHVSFYDGGTSCYEKDNTYRVRCVRRDQ